MPDVCPVRGCRGLRKPQQLLCRPCWRMVPIPLQRQVYAAYDAVKAGPCSVHREEHRAACSAAIAAVEELLATPGGQA